MLRKATTWKLTRQPRRWPGTTDGVREALALTTGGRKDAR